MTSAKRRALLRQTGRSAVVPSTDELFIKARQHVIRLHDVHGMPWPSIAPPCSSATAMRRLAKEDTRRLSRAVALAVLAVRPVAVQRGALVLAVPTQRRLRALMADGFSSEFVGKLLGLSRNNVYDLMNHHQYVCMATSKKVAAVYDQIGEKLPTDFGIPNWLAERTKRLAKGKAPRNCWDADTINDLNAFPEWTGACGTTRGVRIHRAHKIPMWSGSNLKPNERVKLCIPCIDVSRERKNGLRIRDNEQS